jgi:peptidoglycan hydrolase-like protein with peptidoglycan-binding domain
MSSFDQVIKNILSDIFGSNEQEDVVRPQARPSGLGAPTTSPRPRLRPEQDDDDEVAIPSGTESTSKFIAAMADYDDTPEQGVDIPLSTLQTDARNLNGKYKTTAMQLAKLNKGVPLTDGGRANVKVAGIEEDSTLDDLLFDVKVAMNRRSLEEIPLSEKPVVGQGFDMSVKDIQVHLNSRGYDVGGIDGKMGPKTRAAIRSFQKDEGLSVDGIAGKNTQRALQTDKPLAPITVTELGDIDPSVTTPDESRFIARPLDEFMPNLNIGSIRDIKLDTTAIQTKLSGLGYDVGEIDGKIGKRTRKAIRQFQKDKGLVADGIVGPDTTEAMIRAERMSNVDEETGMPDVVQSSIIPSLPKPIQKPAAFATDVFKAVLSPVGRNFMNDIMFGGKTKYYNPLLQLPFGDRLVDRQNTAGAEVFSEDALELMKNIVLDAGIVEKGSVSIGKEIYEKGGISVDQRGGSSAKEIIKSLASGDDPINELKLMLGQFSAKIDENNDIIVTDRFNYNAFINPIDGKEYTPEQYDKAIEEGKFTELQVLKSIFSGDLDYEMVRAAGFVLGSRDYAGEDSRDQGRLFEINLGQAS